MPLSTIEKIGFIGGGNMAEAFVKGLINTGFSKEGIIVSEPNEARRKLMVEQYQIETVSNNKELVQKCEIVVLATKPQIIDKVLDDIKPEFDDATLIVSILAGVTTATIEAGLAGSPRVVRSMPNTPALVGVGAAALCAGTFVTENDRSCVQQLFEMVGMAKWVEETQIDAVTGLSGSGPAYVYTFIEALADGAVQQGLARDVALALAVQTVLGAATLVKESGEHPASLRDKVCSPAGTTISGVRALEDNGFRAAIMEAVGAATKRSKELGS